MAECEPPSFSLGFDLLLDTPPPSPPPPPPAPEDDESLQAPDSDPESGPDPPRPLLKRLRRGPPELVDPPPPPPPPCFDADDDIEEFSSQDDPVQEYAQPSVRNHSVCSSSKVSLHGCGALTPHPASDSGERKRKQGSDIPESLRMETGQSGLVFPKLTASPLRRFQLIDSDSDDPGGEDVSGLNDVDPCLKEAISNQRKAKSSLEQNRRTSFNVNQNLDLERKRKQAWDIPSSSRMETDQSGFVFPNSTASPLRGFRLLDSDSDDPGGEDVSGLNEVDPCLKEATSSHSKPSSSLEQNINTSFNVNQTPDLWKDFSPVKNFSIPTPAFNEVCEEYFHSAKHKKMEMSGIDISESPHERYHGANSSCQKDQQLRESTDPVPPAHHYFFHEDLRIQQLVRSRLCNFSPLGVNRANQQPNASHIDYMGQFDNGGASKTQGVEVSSTTGRKNKSRNSSVKETFNASAGWVDPKIISHFSTGESSKKKATKRNNTRNNVSKRRNETNKSNSSNVPGASGNWVEPKSCTSMPKDAGKRRVQAGVQAGVQSAGHWFTNSDGRKVYVNKSGKELTGRIAYTQYRKESGGGFKKSRKKTSAKKTNFKKKN